MNNDDQNRNKNNTHKYQKYTTEISMKLHEDNFTIKGHIKDQKKKKKTVKNLLSEVA